MRKNQVFLNIKTWKIIVTGTIKNKTSMPGQKTSKNILPGLEPEKVENHWSKWTFDQK